MPSATIKSITKHLATIIIIIIINIIYHTQSLPIRGSDDILNEISETHDHSLKSDNLLMLVKQQSELSQAAGSSVISSFDTPS